MRIARAIGLPAEDQADLFYALLLKDAGCSSNAARVHQLFGGSDHEAKRAVWLQDWRRFHHQLAYALRYLGPGESVWRRLRRLGGLARQPEVGRELFQIRCHRGAEIARALGLSESAARAIHSMDEHWDGGGHPEGLAGEQIPMLARIIGLAQVLEIFALDGGPARALGVARRRRGRWFDPGLVDALRAFDRDATFWDGLVSQDERSLLASAEPRQAAIAADEPRLDGIADAFASVIDAKSPYTSDHSARVATFAEAIAIRLGAGSREVVRLRRAALLHDIGKLGVPNSILDKAGPLTPDEWVIIRRHPLHTFDVLDRVPVFRDFAADAAAHHEMLDGSGYHLGLQGGRLTTNARVLAVADRADALLADRPYRQGLEPAQVLRILNEDCQGGRICAAVNSAFSEHLREGGHPRSDQRMSAS
jgi:putative nucleotidyltransferase with HDIG domain